MIFLKRLGGILLVGYGMAAVLAVALQGQVSYTPQPVAFGAVKLGQSSVVFSATLTNTGTDTLRFCGAMPPGCQGGSSMTGSSAFRYVTDNCTTRPPGGSCILQYIFTPTQVGPLAGANIVQTNHGPFPVNFTGTGVDTATLPPVVKVTAVAVTPLSVTLAVGEFTVQLYGFTAWSDGHAFPGVATLRWASSDTTVATVSQGVVQPIRAGTATITATDSGQTVSGKSLVTVLAQQQVSVFGVPTFTGSRLLPIADSTGKITARLLIVVRGP